MLVLGIDPGPTTGVMIVEFLDKKMRGQTWGQWHGIEELIEIRDWLFDSVDHVVVEDYLIYASKASAHIHSRVPTAKVIGRIEYICHLKDLPITFQTASMAKGQFPLPRVKKYLDNYKSIKKEYPHAIDAFRHIMTFAEREGIWVPTFTEDDII